jgi:hypothetical protein
MRWKTHNKLKQTHGLHSKSRLSPNPTLVNQPTVLEMRYFGFHLVTSRYDINPYPMMATPRIRVSVFS